MLQRLNQFLPIGAALLVVAFLNAIQRRPDLVSVLSLCAALLVSIAFCVWQLGGRQFWRARFWNSLITPLCLVVSGVAFFLFIEDSRLLFVTSVALAAGIWLFLELLYVQQHDRPRYQPHALENISNTLNLLTVFFAASGSLSLSIFLGVNPWLLVSVQGLLWLLLSGQLFWASDLPWSVHWGVTVIIGMLGAEFFIVVQMLPSSVLVGSAILTVCYYALSGIARNWLLQIREPQVMRRYALVSLVSLALLLLTAKWY